jgi:hypothetical protein
MEILLVIAFTLLVSSGAQGAVWENRQEWNETQEAAYSQWAETVPHDIFSNPNSKWYEVGTDCADAVYIIRAIYAYENGLPVLFTSSQTGRATLSNSQKDWDGQPEDRKVRAFFKQLATYTSTATLGRDTYPVKISAEYLKPGIIFLNPKLSREDEEIIGTVGGHAELVWKVEENGFIRTLYSTTPVAVRELLTTRNPYTWPLSREGGFRRWFNPDDRSKPKSSLPAYSDEQFTLSDWRDGIKPTRKQVYQWHETVRRTIRQRPPTVDERQEVVMESICNLWQGRVTAVQKAFEEIKANGSRCLSAGRIDDHSTNRRDARIREAYGQLNDLAFYKKNEYGTDGEGSVKDLKEQLQQCKVQTGWHSLDSWELFLRMVDGRIEPNAAASPSARWGEVPKGGGTRCR